MRTRHLGTPVARLVARAFLPGLLLLGAALLAAGCGGPDRGHLPLPNASVPSVSVESAPAKPVPGESAPTELTTPATLESDTPQAAVGGPVLVGLDLTDPVVAATGFVGMRDDWLYAPNDALEASLRHVIADGDYLNLEKQLLHEGLAPMRQALLEHPDLERTWFVTVPLTAEVVTHTANSARVEVWEVQIFARVSIADPVSTWSIHTVDLTWSDNRWQVTKWKIDPGPTARIDSRQTATAADDLNDELDGHGRLGDPIFETTRAFVQRDQS